jgi:quinolinate synthase
VLEALVYNRTEITVDAAIAGKARAAVERMIELSK